MKKIPSAGLKKLIDSIENSIVINKNEYRYFIHPLTDGIPNIEHSLLDFVSDIIIRILKKYGIENIDKILTIEALGIPLATAVALKLKKNLIIARKRVYGIKDEVVMNYFTGYSSGVLSISNISTLERIVVIDDILSTGGTLKAISEGVQKLGGRIICAIFFIEKEGLRKYHDFSFPIEAVAKVKIENDRVKVLDLHDCCYEGCEGYYSTYYSRANVEKSG